MHTQPPLGPNQPRSQITPVRFGQGFQTLQRLPVSGRIRPGVMVLHPKWKSRKEVSDLYLQGVKSGLSFNDIAQTIENEFGIENALIPKNTPYFVVRPKEWKNEAAAQAFREKFADPKDGRIYRFPVVFATDIKHLVMPTRLGVYTRGGGLKYWQEVDADGSARCKMRQARLDNDGRAIRTGHGRDIVDRPDNGGICNKEKCREFQKKQCKEHGSFVFMVPGIPGNALIEVPTGSFYSREEVSQTLEMIAGLRGTVTGELAPNRTFWMSKVLKKVQQIDEMGNSVMRDCWLITLTTDVDFAQAVSASVTIPPASAEGAAAAALMSEYEIEPADVTTPGEPVPTPTTTNVEAAPQGASGEPLKVKAEAEAPPPTNAGNNAPTEPPTPAAPVDNSAREESKAVSFQALQARLSRMQISLNTFSQQMASTHGPGWLTNEAAMAQATKWLDGIEANRARCRSLAESLGVTSDEFDAYAASEKGKQWYTSEATMSAVLRELEQCKDATAFRQAVVTALSKGS